MRPNFFFHDPVRSDMEILGLTLDEFVAMGEWAFGPQWRYVPRIALRERWNKRHGKELFTLAGHDSAADSVKRIAEAWKAAKK